MSDIPSARLLLNLFAESLEMRGQVDDARVARHALSLMKRRPPARRKAPVQSAVVDDATAETMRAIAHANPNMPITKIAEAFNTNPGRVSEALHEDR